MTRRGTRDRELYIIDRRTGCWIGNYCTDTKGYCQIRVDGRLVVLHKHMYEKYYGKLPVGYELHHACTNKKCCNVFHLKPVTDGQHYWIHDNNGGWVRMKEVQKWLQRRTH